MTAEPAILHRASGGVEPVQVDDPRDNPCERDADKGHNGPRLDEQQQLFRNPAHGAFYHGGGGFAMPGARPRHGQ